MTSHLSETQALTERERLTRGLVSEKHEQARRLLREHGIDCWLIFTREGSDLLLPFVTGTSSLVGMSALMLFADGPSVAIVADYDTGNVEGIFDQVVSYSLDWREPLQTALAARNPAKIALNFSPHDHGIDGLTHGLYLALCDALAPLGLHDRFVSAEPVAAPLRAQKSPAEVERIRRACEITLRIFDDLTAMVRPGMTEADVYDLTVERMQTYQVGPAWDAAYCPTVATSRTRMGHNPPGTTRIEPGDTLRIDLGVVYEGYCSDLQRTWYVRKPGERQAPADIQHAFETVRSAILMAAEIIRPGRTGIEVDQPVRHYMAERGFSFTHALGHQLGRLAHDGGMVLGPDIPRYRERARGTIAAGMVFTLEPCVAPISLEEDVVVTETGCEFLVPPQQALWLI
jgi:Xaa-Pro aminopeptidase